MEISIGRIYKVVIPICSFVVPINSVGPVAIIRGTIINGQGATSTIKITTASSNITYHTVFNVYCACAVIAYTKIISIIYYAIKNICVSSRSALPNVNTTTIGVYIINYAIGNLGIAIVGNANTMHIP